MNITPCGDCVRALILTYTMLFDIRFVEFIRRVYEMSLSLLLKLFRGQVTGGNLFWLIYHDLREKRRLSDCIA
jgi:hypothetical protein